MLLNNLLDSLFELFLRDFVVLENGVEHASLNHVQFLDHFNGAINPLVNVLLAESIDLKLV